MKEKLNISELDLSDEYVVSQIYGEAVNPEIDDEIRNNLFGLAEFVDIYNPEPEEANLLLAASVGGTYNPTPAVAYAKKYAKVPNLEYKN